MLTIINRSTGQVIGDKIKYADSFFLRLKGLLFCEFLAPGEGILIDPCSSVHSFGMKIIIDIAFLDHNFRVLKTVSNMRPGRTAGQKKARYVLEMPSGTNEVKGIKVGDLLLMIKY